MRRFARREACTLAALLMAACGGDAAESEDTSGTTRALLQQTVVAGPSTNVEGDTALTSGVTQVNLPDLGYDRGEVSAPLKVIEFSDFGCGFCRRFHEETFPTLKTQFIDSGMIEWKFMAFVSGNFPNSLAASEAAECVLEQQEPAYEALGGTIWLRQPEWKESREPEGLLRSWVADLGIDMDRWDSCMGENRRYPRIAGATAVAEQLGIRGTPTFWIVGYGPLQGALPLDAFQGILSTVHAEVVAGGPGPGRGGAPN